MRDLRRLYISLLIVVITAAASFGGLPQTINHQGYLTGSNGAPATGPLSMVFSLYSSNPARNNPVWRETQGAVPLNNGIYSTRLGSATPISASFDVPYYLGVKVGSDPEMALQALSSVPYAQRAAIAEAVTGAIITNPNIVGPVDGTKINGAQITSLNASHLTSGTVPDSQLPANLVRTDLTQTFTAPHPFSDGSLMLFNSGNTAATVVNAPTATSTRTISMPDASGTVITSGNLADISTAGSAQSTLQIGGSVKVGTDTSTCNAIKSGAIRLAGSALEACDGTNWTTATILMKPVIWSGGCNIHGLNVGWNIYCLNSSDFNTASEYFTVNPSGTVTFLKSGYYRFNAYLINMTSNNYLQLRFQKNGAAFYSGYDYSTGFWNGRNADIIFPFNTGDTFVMDVNNTSGGYAYHSYSPSGAFSRLQIMFVGPQ